MRTDEEYVRQAMQNLEVLDSTEYRWPERLQLHVRDRRSSGICFWRQTQLLLHEASHRLDVLRKWMWVAFLPL